MKAKIELHCHFDGSLDVETSYQLAKKRKLIDTNLTYSQFQELMRVPKDNKNLATFLDRFALPIALLQDEEAIISSMLALIKNLNDEGLIYVEIRFAPQAHIQGELTQEDVVDAALKARTIAKVKYPNIKVNFILCMMIYGGNINEDLNRETIRVTKQFLNQGVVALDLAGYEGGYPMKEFKILFDEAKGLAIPYTIHAGESGPASHVEDAIYLGAARIGHGGHCIDDSRIMQLVIAKQIPLEMCLTSNIQCNNQPSYENHAFHKLYKEGAIVTLNTDNRTLSDIDLNYEYQQLLKTGKITVLDLELCTINAIKSAFITDKEKTKLYQLCNIQHER